MLSPEAEEALLNHPWPGNVRELENVIERAVVMSGQETLTPEAFAFDDKAEEDELQLAASAPEAAATPPQAAADAATVGDPEDEAAGTLQATLDRAATVRIKAALDAVGGNRIEAANILGVDRTTLYRLMKRLGL